MSPAVLLAWLWALVRGSDLDVLVVESYSSDILANYQLEHYELAVGDLQQKLNVGFNTTMHTVNSGDTIASTYDVIGKYVDSMSPCVVVGPSFSHPTLNVANARAAAEMASHLKLPFITSMGLPDMFRFPEKYKTFVGTWADPASYWGLDVLAARHGWERMAVLIDIKDLNTRDPWVQSGKARGLDIQVEVIDFASVNFAQQIKQIAENLVKNRLSIFFMTLTANPAYAHLRETFYQTFIDAGLAGPGTMWFFSTGGEEPYDFVNYTGSTRGPIGEAFKESLVMTLAPGSKDDPTDWNWTLSSWNFAPEAQVEFVTSIMQLAQIRQEQTPTFWATAKHIRMPDRDCVVNGATDNRCWPLPPPTPELVMLMVGTFYFSVQKVYVELSMAAKQAGLCEAPLYRTDEGIKKWNELVMTYYRVRAAGDPFLFQCDGGSASSPHTCTSRPGRKMPFTLTSMKTYPAEYVWLARELTGGRRVMGFVSPNGTYIDIDSHTGWRPSDVTMLIDGEERKWMGNTTQAPTDYLPWACGNRAYINSSAKDRACVQCGWATSNPLNGSNDCSQPFAEPCQEGEFWSWADLKCHNCPPGSYAAEAMEGTADLSRVREQCEACPAGSFAADPGALQCSACSPGSVAPLPGQATCQACERGTFSTDRSQECSPCQGSRTTDNQGSASPDDCSCKQGYVLLSSGNCTPCSVGFECLGGSAHEKVALSATLHSLATVASNADGIYHELPEIFACTSLKTCPGQLPPGECPLGHRGVACSACDVGYCRHDTSCKPCSTGGSLIILAPVFLLVLCPILLQISVKVPTQTVSPANAAAALGGIGLTFFQLLGSLGGVVMNWPDDLIPAMGLTQVLLVDAEIFEVGALVQGGSVSGTSFFQNESAWASSGWILFLLLATLALLPLTWAITQVLPSNLPMSKLPLFALVNAGGLVGQLFFIPLTRLGYSTFHCYPHPSGKTSMLEDPSVLCYDDRGNYWSHRFPLGLVALLLSLSFITAILLLVYKIPSMNSTARVSFLVGKFVPDAYWWGFVVLVRNLQLGVAPALVPDNPFVGGSLMITIHVFYLAALVGYKPWKLPFLNYAEASASIAQILIITSGAFFLRMPTYPNSLDQSAAHWWILQLLTVAPVFLAMAFCLVCLWHSMRLAHRNTRQQLLTSFLADLEEMMFTPCASLMAANKSEEGQKAVMQNAENLSFKDVQKLLEARHLLETVLCGRASRAAQFGARVRVGTTDITEKFEVDTKSSSVHQV